MDYSTYSYHCSKHVTKPRKSNKNIKGLELEISDYDAGCCLDEMVEENLLTVPSNEHVKKEYTIAIEDDGSVYKELIFKASSNRTLLKGVKMLEENLHNEICNSHGTSCHIHINNEFIYDLGLKKHDIVKACEFLAPILYKISGRDDSSMRDWARSALEDNISITNNDLYKRALHVEDNLQTYNGRYAIVNCEGEYTTEIRIFSNYYNFDYKYIKMYLECVDFIIDLAQIMKGKHYYWDFRECFEATKEFFNKRKYKQITERHNLKQFFLSVKERQLANLDEELRYIKSKMNWLRNIYGEDIRQNAIETLRVLRNYSDRYHMPEFEFNITNFNLNDIENIIVNDINLRINEVEAQEE